MATWAGCGCLRPPGVCIRVCNPVGATLPACVLQIALQGAFLPQSRDLDLDWDLDLGLNLDLDLDRDGMQLLM
jgi:hypothetical protein